jgi:hypothetical protein
VRNPDADTQLSVLLQIGSHHGGGGSAEWYSFAKGGKFVMAEETHLEIIEKYLSLTQKAPCFDFIPGRICLDF